MPFRPDRLTVKAAEGVQSAQHLAQERGNPQVAPLHLLSALLDEQGGIVKPIVQKVGVNYAQRQSRRMGCFNPRSREGSDERTDCIAAV